MQLFENALKDQLETYLQPAAIEKIADAFVLADEAHTGQTRASGEPYITHPLAVTRILASLHLDQETLMAALLHDTIEDTPVDFSDLQIRFGENVALLVDGVSKLDKIRFNSRAEAQAENLRKMMMAMVKDIRVILIKLADRLHNMQTLGVLRPDKQRRIATETLDIFAPIAHRLGIFSIRDELQDLSFSVLYPYRHRVLKSAVDTARGDRLSIVESISQDIEARLKDNGIEAWVVGRRKNLYSIYRKMRAKKLSLKEVMDIYGFRIITQNLDSCYRVLGALHTLYKPVPGRFKDYIAIPKANGYQSLHSTLIGPDGLHIEAQIRTEEMEELALTGVAAHWLYQSDDENTNTAQLRAREWMRNLMELQKNTGDSMEFIESVKIDLFPEEVYVFTPDGEIRQLPMGSTPIDFAYAIHTDVGDSCVAAKVDRVLSPLTTPLVNGQTVEIITVDGARPNPAWLQYVVTAKARTSIRHYLKTKQTHDAESLGRQWLESALKKPVEQISPDICAQVLANTGHTDFNALLVEIGLGNVPAWVIAHKMQSPETSENNAENTIAAFDTDKPLTIHGAEGLMVQYARCCYPIPGDLIAGVVTAGHGVTLHREDCNNIIELRKKSDKCLRVEWAATVRGEFHVWLRVDVLNQRGVLAEIADGIADQKGNIVNIEIDERDGSYNTLTFLLMVFDRAHVAKIFKRLRQIPSVTRVQRCYHR